MHTGGAGFLIFLDVRALAVILAFAFSSPLLWGLIYSEDTTAQAVMQASISTIFLQAVLIFIVAFLGEALQKTAELLFIAILLFGLTRVLTINGPFFFGRDLLLLYTLAMSFIIYRSAKHQIDLDDEENQDSDDR
ncbi:hypothetical protein QWY82_05255 [Simiduia curdlanivorans]|uniref:Uncharacterized protein n=1 Tax=Simiduia curdlanivorans TaxID=1492769 RepID=A0ABV8V3H5_9GAMM|nr:hypothetical protein [Simiduia curdlanivorans]MDN3638217.1 hypothetical protein [Simiduia curdlanivorans]